MSRERPAHEPSDLWKQDILQNWRDRCIEPPRLYGYGLAHCELHRLLRPGRPGPVVADAPGQPGRLPGLGEARRRRPAPRSARTSPSSGTARTARFKPLSLQAFRERLAAAPTMFDAADWGACGCFMADEAATAARRGGVA